MRPCYPACLGRLVRRARDERAYPHSRARAQVFPAASCLVARVSPHCPR